jgi:1-acyl-sn-glycerol-3-phosphate acyltransferases
MMIIRTILFQAYMWIELLLLMFVWLRVQWANHFSPREKRDALVDRIVRNWAKRLLFMAGAKVTVTGRENIPEGRTCVFASNHQSFFDILVLLAHLDRPHAILSKASIGKVPMIRLWMKEIHCVYVDRSDMKAGIEAINRMIDVIKDGYSAIIFPEGTRSKTGEVGEFKGGAFKVAQKTGAPVIPVALDGTGALFERNHYWIRPGKVHLAILPPIETEGMGRAESKELPDKTQRLVTEAKEAFSDPAQ